MPQLVLNPDRDIYFISDVHAGSNNKELEKRKEQKLIAFLNHLLTLSPVPHLYIVGDLFDFWFEYRHTIPTAYQYILGKLSILTEAGIEIRYVTGNHDFWMEDYFPDQMKIPVFHGAHSLRVGSQNIHIHHGDGILDEDFGYRLLKRILRNRLVIVVYRMLHPDFGIPFARWASSVSRKHSKRTPEQAKVDDEKYDQYAMEQFTEGNDFVVIGHTHRPRKVTAEKAQYVNLGDWIEHFTFARFDGAELNLFHWNDSGQPVPYDEGAESLNKKRIPETL